MIGSDIGARLTVVLGPATDGTPQTLNLPFGAGELARQDAETCKRNEDARTRRDQHHESGGGHRAADAADDHFARRIGDAPSVVRERFLAWFHVTESTDVHEIRGRTSLPVDRGRCRSAAFGAIGEDDADEDQEAATDDPSLDLLVDQHDAGDQCHEGDDIAD